MHRVHALTAVSTFIAGCDTTERNGATRVCPGECCQDIDPDAQAPTSGLKTATLPKPIPLPL